MALHIIIDGYNMIRQSSELRRFEQMELSRGREELIRLLAAYRKARPHRITVVFDGAGAPPATEDRDRISGIRIRFSRGGEPADAVIQRMADRERERALVVSSDRAVTDYAAARGAAVIDSAGFEERLLMAAYEDPQGGGGRVSDGWTPTTRKKGPRKRASKRQRKNRRKLGKL